MKKISLALFASMPLLTPMLVEAVSVSTDPVGFINLTIKGTDAGTGLTAVSVPMLPQVVYSGVISGAAGTEITDDSATWGDNQYPTYDPDDGGTDYDALAAYYVEITNHSDSAQIGTIFEVFGSSSSSKTLTVRGDATGLDGASYSIRKFRTLSDVFGETNTAGLTTAAGASSSDVIYKVGEEDGNVGFLRYYYQTAPAFAGGDGWRKAGDSNTEMKDLPIYPDEGLIVRRRSASDVSVTLPGSIKTNSSRKSLLQGFNLVAPSYPVERTLDQLGLDDSKLTSKAGPSDSDVIYMLDSSGQFERFYYQTAPAFAGGNGWRKAGDSSTDQKDTKIPAGSALIVLRRDSSAVDWSLNVPF